MKAITFNVFIPLQLASALSSVQTASGSGPTLTNPFQGVTGLAPPTRAGEPASARQSAPTTPHNARITADMFQARIANIIAVKVSKNGFHFVKVSIEVKLHSCVHMFLCYFSSWQAAMQAALFGMGGGVEAAAAAPPQAAAPEQRSDWSSQLQHMREMGIVDEVIQICTYF
jgi:hypothetical protein